MPILVPTAIPEPPPGVPWPTRVNEMPSVWFTDPPFGSNIFYSDMLKG